MTKNVWNCTTDIDNVKIDDVDWDAIDRDLDAKANNDKWKGTAGGGICTIGDPDKMF